jgi:hypothetical protein
MDSTCEPFVCESCDRSPEQEPSVFNLEIHRAPLGKCRSSNSVLGLQQKRTGSIHLAILIDQLLLPSGDSRNPLVKRISQSCVAKLAQHTPCDKP